MNAVRDVRHLASVQAKTKINSFQHYFPEKQHSLGHMQCAQGTRLTPPTSDQFETVKEQVDEILIIHERPTDRSSAQAREDWSLTGR